MTDSVIRYARPSIATRDLLRRLLADRPEPYAQGVTVGTKVPVTKSDDNPILPLVAVRTDGIFKRSDLSSRATVRVLVWHRDEGLCEELAGLCEALLLAASSPEIRSVGSLTGPLSTVDVDTGDPMAYFTVTARLRPASLLSQGDPRT